MCVYVLQQHADRRDITVVAGILSRHASSKSRTRSCATRGSEGVHPFSVDVWLFVRCHRPRAATLRATMATYVRTLLARLAPLPTNTRRTRALHPPVQAVHTAGAHRPARITPRVRRRMTHTNSGTEAYDVTYTTMIRSHPWHVRGFSTTAYLHNTPACPIPDPD